MIGNTSKKRRRKRAKRMLKTFLSDKEVNVLMAQLDWKHLEALTKLVSRLHGRSEYSW